MSEARSEARKPWARLRKHGPAMIFDWHATKADARAAIQDSAVRHGEQVIKLQSVAYFPDDDDRALLSEVAIPAEHVNVMLDAMAHYEDCRRIPTDPIDYELKAAYEWLRKAAGR